MTGITIRELTTQDALLHFYPREQGPQDCYLQLDTRDGEFTADWNGEIGNAVPSEVYHGTVRRFYIPVLKADTVNGLLRRLAPLAQTVMDGTEIVWDGNNHVAQLNANGQCAEAMIGANIEQLGHDPDLHWRDADEWLYDIRDDVRERLEAGETVDALITEFDGDGITEDAPVLVGLRRYLENLD